MRWTLIMHGWLRVGNQWIDPMTGYGTDTIDDAYVLHSDYMAEALSDDGGEVEH